MRCGAEVSAAAAIAFAGMAWAQDEVHATEGARKADPINAVVKLEVSTSKPDIRRPWIMNDGGGNGSGVVIGDGRILTCAHCVADASNPAEARQVITDACLQRGSYLFEAVPDEMFETLSSDINGTMIKYRGKEIRIPFVGQHQVRNAAVAIKACEVIGVNGIDITLTHIKKGLESSFIPARTEIISFNPTVLLDGSHNDDSTKALADVIHKYLPDKRIFAVMGMMADKDCKKALLNLSGCFSKVIAVTPSNPRAMQAEDFCRLLLEAGFDASVQQDPKKAIDEAIAKISEYDALIVCGSLYLASDVREYLIKKFRSL